MKTEILLVAALASATITMHAHADDIRNDDVIIQGKFCSGIDCVNDQIFGVETVLMRENNTRLTFIDVSADPSAQSWRMVANSRTDGGDSYFQFHVQPDLTATDAGTAVAHFGVPGNGSVALGNASDIVNGAVSIGHDTGERRIAHVARATADTDAVTLADIAAYGQALNDILDAVELPGDTFNNQLDAIDVQLDTIERAIQAAERSKLVRSGGGSTGLAMLIGLLGCLMFAPRRPDTGGVE